MKVLLVSIAFPPKRDPESLQVAKYCKYLKTENGIQLEVVTSSDPTLFMETDESLLPYREGIKVASEIHIHENKYINYLVRKINPAWLHYPDSKFTFWWQARKILRSVEKPDVLYSRSYPVSSTLLALKLRKKWKIPFVMHLSDPWSVSSEDSLSPATRLTGKAREWNRKKELECIELADKVCLTSMKTIELYSEEYPAFRNKFVYMPNVFDDELIQPNPFTPHVKLTFLYTGGFGEARSPQTLLDAIRIFWEKRGAEIESKVQFLFTGEMTRRNQAIFKAHEAIPIIRHLGMIPYSKVVAQQREADVLINVDSDIRDPRHAVFFPSKLLDYMVAQRTIVAITNKHSTTHEVVQGKLGECFGFNDSNALAQYFDSCLEKFSRHETSAFTVREIEKTFSAKHNAKRLSDLLLSLCK